MAAFVDHLTEPGQWTDDARMTSALAEFSVRSASRPSAKRSPPRADDYRLSLLHSVVETEVLPRLVLARRAAASRAASAKLADETAELVRLALADDVDGAVAYIERLRAAGASAESLLLGLLTNAARRLGEFWLADRVNFMQVTIATGHLQRLLHLPALAFQTAAAIRADAASVLLIAVPGEQHTFGLSMLGEFFRRAGWHVSGGPGASVAEMLDTVRQNWTDVAALSVGSVAMLNALAPLIRRVRCASRNPRLFVMVGGPLLQLMPELAQRVGADAAATDAPAAVRLASDMLTMRVAAE
jgi:methanogenic corrinoid protein MtbC1